SSGLPRARAAAAPAGSSHARTPPPWPDRRRRACRRRRVPSPRNLPWFVDEAVFARVLNVVDSSLRSQDLLYVVEERLGLISTGELAKRLTCWEPFKGTVRHTLEH